MKYEWLVRCKSCNYCFISPKPLLKSRIALHLNKSHKNPILPSEVNIRDIFEEGIICTRIPENLYDLLKEQMTVSSFWENWRVIFKIAKELNL